MRAADAMAEATEEAAVTDEEGTGFVIYEGGGRTTAGAATPRGRLCMRGVDTRADTTEREARATEGREEAAVADEERTGLFFIFEGGGRATAGAATPRG